MKDLILEMHSHYMITKNMKLTAKHYNKHATTLLYHFKKLGLEILNRGTAQQKLSNDEILTAYNEYINSTDSLETVAKRYDIVPTTLHKRFKKMNLKCRRLEETYEILRTNVNDQYFSTINAEVAYWIGFIYADGCITTRNTLHIALAEKDKDHVFAFSSAINIDKQPRYVKQNKAWSISIKSKQIVNDLMQIGVRVNKTYTGTPIPNIPSEYYNDFIRGYFDGDGCISNNTVAILGHKELLEWMQQHLELSELSSIRKRDNYYVLVFGSKIARNKFTDAIYANKECIKLERKYSKFVT